MALKTPPLNANGVYSLISPWQAVASTTYTCIAVRSYQDLLQHGVDILNTYYTPMGLGKTQYQADLAVGANLVTLISPNQPTIYVPDTYIKSYPDLSNVGYQNVILSCQLGPLPDTLNLAFLEQQVAALVSDTVGVTPVMNSHVSASTQVITPAQAAALETARQAAITNRTTDRAQVLALQAQVAQLNALIQTYQNLAIANNWVAPTPAPSPAADGTAAAFTSVATGLSVAFTDTSTAGTGFTIASWAWNFGDGTTSSVQNPTHLFGAAGTFLVELTVTDSNGQTAKTTSWITVAAAAPAPMPAPAPAPTVPPAVPAADGTTANFTTAINGLTVTFTDTSTPGSGLQISAWGWNFGDGTGGPGTSTLQNPQYTYAQAGTYVVAMQVMDSNNQQATVYKEVTVA